MNNNQNRIDSVIKNSSIALITQVIYIIVSFVCRTIFTQLLGSEYLGVNGLFTNILTILSFAELGIGSALVFRMYEPLANHDYKKLSIYLNFYKKVYRYIILIILGVGIALAPFIPKLVAAPDIKESIVLLYMLYLLDTVISYVYVYKKSLLIADQKNYIVNIYTQVFNIIMNVLQIIALIFTHNFIVYCGIKLICRLLNNIFCSRYVDKHYADMLIKVNEPLEKNEVQSLKEDVKGLMLRKISGVSFNGTDNIIISTFVGINYVGIISNYTMLISMFNTIMNKIFSSITATLGNLIIENDSQKTEDALNNMFFLNSILYGYICIGMYFLLQEFVMNIWLSKTYYLSQSIIFIMLLEFYLRGIHYPIFITRSASGKFSQLKWINVFCAVLNIILDVIFVKTIGLIGVFIATLISYIIHRFADIYVVYKIILSKMVVVYYKKIITSLLFLLCIGSVIQLALRLCTGEGIIYFIIRIILVTIIYWIMVIVVYKRSTEYKYLKKIILKNNLKK